METIKCRIKITSPDGNVELDEVRELKIRYIENCEYIEFDEPVTCIGNDTLSIEPIGDSESNEGEATNNWFQQPHSNIQYP